MITGSNPRLSYAILGHKISFMYIKPQKGTFICPKLMPKAEKIKKQKINSVPFQTTVLDHSGTVTCNINNRKSTLIYYSESYHQSLLKLQAKTIVLTGANLVHDSFWLMFLALQRVLLKDRFHHFYKLLPFFSFFPSYQNLLETDNNPNPHWLLFLEGFYNCFTIPGIQG